MVRLWYQLIVALLVLAAGITTLAGDVVPTILSVGQIVAGVWLAAAVAWTMLRRPRETS